MAAPVNVGVLFSLELTATEGTGTPTVTVTLPDATTTTPAVSGSGPWSATLPTTQAGRHLVTWDRGSALVVDVLDVWPADPHYLVSIDDAAAAVVSSSGSSLPAATRAELPLFVAAAAYVIESLTGPLVPATRTAKRDGGRPAVVLPVEGVTVSAVSVNGTALAATDYVVDEEAGIVRSAVGWFSAGGPLNVEITYTIGSSTIPANVRLACLELIAYLWQTSRQGARAVASDTMLTPSGFAIPRRVAELCAATHRPTVIG